MPTIPEEMTTHEFYLGAIDHRKKRWVNNHGVNFDHAAYDAGRSWARRTGKKTVPAFLSLTVEEAESLPKYRAGRRHG